jgi:hypothetical protein
MYHSSHRLSKLEPLLPRGILPIIPIRPRRILPPRNMDIQEPPVERRPRLLHIPKHFVCAYFNGEVGVWAAEVRSEPLRGVLSAIPSPQ